MSRLIALALACLASLLVVFGNGPWTPAAAATQVEPTEPALLPLPLGVAADPPELRAVWVDAFHDGFKTPQQVDRLVAWARRANLNALFVQVRRRGDAYYTRSLDPRSEDPDLAPGFDALQYLLDRAHEGPRKLQVHAWLATLPIWHKHDQPPLAPSHIFNRFGLDVPPEQTWLMLRDDGEAWAGEGASGTYYADPGHPDAARYTAEVYRDLLRNYAVDGIHLDQVRYFEGDARRWGYNPTSVARFNQHFGLARRSLPDPNDPRWSAWRRDQVTALVRRIYLEAHAIRPDVTVSAAVVTWGSGPSGKDGWERTPAFANVFQDWRLWLDEGIVDYLLPMAYYREIDPHATWFDNWTTWQTANPGRRGMAIGVGAYLNDADNALAQLRRARSLRSLGVALYSYAVPTSDFMDGLRDDQETFADRLRELFRQPAPLPELPWQTRPVAGSVMVEVAGREDLLVVLEGGPAPRRVWRTDGTGLAGSVDVAPGSYRLSVVGVGVDPSPVEIRVEVGRTSVVTFGPGTRAV